jgi:hypothetical protein
MTRDTQQALVKGWAETGALLAKLRWEELRALNGARALYASNYLIDAALRIPLPAARRSSSGLVDQQTLFRRGHR